jgi:CheY-like chemotaxis protein
METDMVPTSKERPRVLLVDDDERFSAVVASLLAGDGYDVVGTVARATEVVTAVDLTHPDLIVIDLVMPDGDGLDVADELRDTGHQQPIVVFSSIFDRRAHRTTVREGYGYVEKVDGIERLEEEIDERLSG